MSDPKNFLKLIFDRREDIMSGEGNLLKILVLGDTATGKTSFIKRYVHNTHSKDHKATVGVDFVLKQLQVNKKSVRRA